MNTSTVQWTARDTSDADFEHASRLRKLFSTGQGSDRRSCEPDYYRWKLLSNVASRGCLRVADDHGRIVGMTTLTPKTIVCAGEEILGAEIGDTFTHPDYQRQGMFSALVRMTCAAAPAAGLRAIYGTPNNLSLPGYEKLGFVQAPHAHVVNCVYPLNHKAVMQEYVKRPLVTAVAAPVTQFVCDAWFSRRRSAPAVSTRQVKEFPEAVARLSSACSARYGWMLKRDKRYLDWRFVLNPDRYGITICESRNQLAGYLVTKIGSYSNLRVGYLADFLVDPEVPDAFSALCLSVIDDWRRQRFDMVAGWAVAGGGYQAALARLGFLKFKPVPIIFDPGEVGQRMAKIASNWHFTMADSDNI